MRRRITTISIRPDLLKDLKNYSKDKGFDSISRVVERCFSDPGIYQDFKEHQKQIIPKA